MKFIKYLPNVITVSRIITSILLITRIPLSKEFYILYSYSGISDMLDGLIARKFKWTSKFGAIIDSIADFLFISITMIILIPKIQLPNWLLFGIFVIIAIRIVTLIVGFIKYYSFVMFHTYANKITGFALFCFPFFYQRLNILIVGIGLLLLGMISSLDELIIMIKTTIIDRNIKSSFNLNNNSFTTKELNNGN